MISELIAAEETGERLSHGEVLSTCWLLLIAGHETTTGLLTNGMRALLSHRSEWEKLCANPGLLDSAIEELLRYDAPVQRMPRFALQDVELGGIAMKQEQHMGAIIGAANRDPLVFKDPHRLDITRDPNPHLSFGKGIHYCLGAPLARLEAEIAFGQLVRRFPNMVLDEANPPVWSANTRFRSVKSLPVRLA